MGKVPGEVAADYRIKAFIRILQVFPIHLFKTDSLHECSCILTRFLQHSRCQIHRRYIIPQFTEDDSEEARTGSDFQDPKSLSLVSRQDPLELLLEAVFPLLPLIARELCLIYFGVA